VSSTVTHLTRHFVLTRSYASISTSVGVVAIALLVALLAQRELARSLRTQRSARVLDVVIVPLVLVWAIILIVRFRHLMR
jgi:VanZ family protein